MCVCGEERGVQLQVTSDATTDKRRKCVLARLLAGLLVSLFTGVPSSHEQLSDFAPSGVPNSLREVVLTVSHYESAKC